jgi:predicted nucleic acid-binding protein
MEAKDGRDCIHFDTSVWLSLHVKEREIWEKSTEYLRHIIFGKQTRGGMSIVILGEILYKLVEFFRKDPETLRLSLEFIDNFIIKGKIVIHNLDDSDFEAVRKIKEETGIRAHPPELLEIAVALRTGAKVFETMDEIVDSDVLRGYLKERGLLLKKFNPG